jgi:NAD(P)H-hydrate epimerase
VVEVPEKEDAEKLVAGADIVIDAMLGVGISGELKEPYATYAGIIEACRAIVVSVDAPTGLGTSTKLTPDYTVTFHDSKVGMNGKNSGEIAVVPIGIPEDAERYIGPGELAVYYPKPGRNSHKGQNGRLLIVGGGPYTGAPALAALAALRSGVDLVHIATPTKAASIIAGFSPNFIVHELTESGGKLIGPEDIDKVLELCSMSDACVLGPGIGRDEQTLAFITNFLAQCPIPVILDADGISAVDAKTAGKTKRPSGGWIITPHGSEFLDLVQKVLGKTAAGKKGKGKDKAGKTEAEDRDVLCKDLATKLGAIVVLKGNIDLVCDGERHKYNRTGNPGMTVGGTGDILAGIIGALASKKVDLYNSARMGAYLSGRAGDIVWKKKGPGLTATDIAEAIPKVLVESIDF